MSFSFGSQTVHVWGVMNLTPDSFSDGGVVASRESFHARLTAWLPWVDGIDVGAESTAPMNASISSVTEIERLEAILLPVLPSWPSQVVLSLDTYKLETMNWLLAQAPAHVSVVWNDVSGQLDESVMALLKKHPNLKYVLCHNPAPKRSLAGRHMDYATEGAITPMLRDFFRPRIKKLLEHDVFSRVILDPCFGFGKTRAQNHALLRELPHLMDELAAAQWMWGVSRKSFLRASSEIDPKQEAHQQALDGMAQLWYQESLSRVRHPHTIFLRTHAPLYSRGLASWSTLKASWNSDS